MARISDVKPFLKYKLLYKISYIARLYIFLKFPKFFLAKYITIIFFYCWDTLCPAGLKPTILIVTIELMLAD